ncbi:MAG: DUF2764 domain-containing protein [Thermoguttaceae bacterium]|nr:DUF2764 domain-containing protein [Thermoguttaceae bacterium]MDW8078891.1 DUF2764 family protein [Thermoguttaceae bacterium]
MLGRLRYFITALPGLGTLGTVPPIGLAELLEHLSGAPRPRHLVETIALLDDLEQREAYLAGELKQVEPTVLTVEQVKGESPLPGFLSPEASPHSYTIELDRLWASYFHHVYQLAGEEDCEFLRRWVGFEVALRNALAVARARKLELDESGFVVAPELADPTLDFANVISEWSVAKTPLAGLQVVIRARWDWCDAHEAWFSFTEDEILVYALRLMLLEQWRRTSGEGKPAEG